MFAFSETLKYFIKTEIERLFSSIVFSINYLPPKIFQTSFWSDNWQLCFTIVSKIWSLISSSLLGIIALVEATTRSSNQNTLCRNCGSWGWISEKIEKKKKSLTSGFWSDPFRQSPNLGRSNFFDDSRLTIDDLDWRLKDFSQLGLGSKVRR